MTTLQGNVTTLQGQITNINGKLADAVLYDSSTHNSVTLGGVGASTNVKLTNVAAGTLSSTSTDAVNCSQLGLDRARAETRAEGERRARSVRAAARS
ncbi:hypothetical protein, partial [Paraburkholderia sp. SIMBA_030]|uniref:hypothetical protein n=1 Tax=Paraburkholderia sp. SIMBA_030 TaxID=3085773 RepID=UPI00397AB421